MVDAEYAALETEARRSLREGAKGITRVDPEFDDDARAQCLHEVERCRNVPNPGPGLDQPLRHVKLEPNLAPWREYRRQVAPRVVFLRRFNVVRVDSLRLPHSTADPRPGIVMRFGLALRRR